MDIIIENFLIVDCRNRTELSVYALLPNEKLDDKRSRTSGFFGGYDVDREFLAFIEEKFGSTAIQMIREHHNEQLQYMIDTFCRNVKFLFTGEWQNYKTYELDLEEFCPVIKQYVTGEILDQLEEDEWIIEFKFEDVKKMFDPVIKKIIRLIRDHVNKFSDTIHSLILVGGFSESKYLQNRIQEEFSDIVENIVVPPQPIAATVRGGNYKINWCILHIIDKDLIV